MATAAIDDDSFLEEEDAPLELEEEEPEPATTGKRRSTRASSASSGSSRRPRVVVEEPEATEGVLWLSTIVLSAVIMFLGLLCALDAAQGVPSGLTDGLQSWIKNSFLS